MGEGQAAAWAGETWAPESGPWSSGEDPAVSGGLLSHLVPLVTPPTFPLGKGTPWCLGDGLWQLPGDGAGGGMDDERKHCPSWASLFFTGASWVQASAGDQAGPRPWTHR